MTRIEQLKTNLSIFCKKKYLTFGKYFSATLATEWTIFNATESGIDFALKSFWEDQFIKINATEWPGFWICSIIVIIASVTACFFHLYEPFFVEFPIANGKTSIKIEFGDIFEKKNIVAIGVNNFFDSCTDYGIIKEPSLHWQLITKILNGNAKIFDDAVEIVRKQGVWTPGRIDTPNKDLRDKKHRCDIGSTAILDYKGVKYACTVISEMPNDSFVAESSNEKIMKATKQMLNEVRGICGDEEIAIPVWGTGLSRCILKEKQMIELLLATILETSSEQRVSKKITIVLYKNMYGEVDLTALKEKWGNYGLS